MCVCGVCACVYVKVLLCVYMCVPVYVWLFVYACTCVCVCLCVHMYIKCVYVYVHMCMSGHVCERERVRETDRQKNRREKAFGGETNLRHYLSVIHAEFYDRVSHWNLEQPSYVRLVGRGQ